MAKQKPWRAILNGFISSLRIVSREETAKLGEAGVALKLWNSQRRILNEVAAGMDQGIRKFYVLKSRQLGSTTIFVILMLFWLALHPRTKGALVVDQDKTRDDFRETIRNIIESIPGNYFGGAFSIKKNADNKYFMGFTNGSQLNFLVAGTSGSKESWGESAGYSLVVVSEIAKFGSEMGLLNFEEAMSDDNPDRFYVYESTANGPNHWQTRWKSAADDPFTIRRIFVGWWSKELNQVPKTDPRFSVYGLQPPDERERERIRKVKEKYDHEITAEQLCWFRWRMSQPGQTERALLQNQPWDDSEAFVLSGKSFFQIRVIMQDYDRLGGAVTGQPVVYQGYRFWLGEDFWKAEIENLGGDVLRQREVELRIWEQPMPEGRYVIGCDPAGGSDDRNDRHCVTVFRCFGDKLVQVAEYADNQVATRQCAWVLAYMAGIYRNCMINLELSGGYGNAVLVELNHLREMLRADIYSTRKAWGGKDLSDFLDNARWYIYRKPDNPTAAGYIINWKTNGDNKRQILNQFRDVHINGDLIINSKPLLEEMQIIVQDGSTIQASGGQKDDRCIAACLATHAWIEHERSGLLMAGETYEAVMARESGEHPTGDVINGIVQQYFRQIELGQVEEEMTPARSWMEARGLA